jgi:hypothetical protein
MRIDMTFGGSSRMMPSTKTSTRRIAQALALAALTLASTGCGRYMTNRYYDFRDVLALGAGVSREEPAGGLIPSFGALVEVTDFAQLGWIRFNGVVAEEDLRGTYVGPEQGTRMGFLWWQRIHKNQDYTRASYLSAFKNRDFPWTARMESAEMRFGNRPAKSLHYERWADRTYEGAWLLHRGWQYWGYVGGSVAISDPLITHHGLMLRLGIDFSEIFDFLGGWFTYDFRKDDMTPEEYEQLRNPQSWQAGDEMDMMDAMDGMDGMDTMNSSGVL